MTAKFEMFAEAERRLREMFQQPIEDVLGLTKTERKRIAKDLRRKPKAMPIAVPDRTQIRLSCLPMTGQVVVKEFVYYTPFVTEALERAYREISQSGEQYRSITVLENDKVEIS